MLEGMKGSNIIPNEGSLIRPTGKSIGFYKKLTEKNELVVIRPVIRSNIWAAYGLGSPLKLNPKRASTITWFDSPMSLADGSSVRKSICIFWHCLTRLVKSGLSVGFG